MAYQLLCLGDSQTLGNHVGAGEDYPSLVRNALGVTVTNLGQGGATVTSGQTATAIGLYNGALARNIACVWFGPNDMVSEDGAAYKAAMKTQCLSLISTGFNVLAFTVLNGNTYPEWTARRNQANPLIRADASFYTTCVDLAADPTIGPDSAINNATYFQPDNHLTAAGLVIVSTLVLAAINVVLASGHFGTLFAGAVR